MLFVLPALAVTPDHPASPLNDPAAPRAVRLNAEVGFVAPLSHVIQFGDQGTEIDYLQDGGQDNLFPFARLSADLDLGERHTVILLAQPLDLRSTALLERDLVVDGATFPKDSGVNFRYGFSYYRASWLYDVAKSDERELGFGLSMQLRNATIGFESTDGTIVRNNRNIGIVPILKVRGRTPVGDSGLWLGMEADGFYAPVSYLNGDNNDVVGAILDASVRAGIPMKYGGDVYLNVRSISGGAEGWSDNATYPGDGWTRNWLHFTTVSIGFSLR